MKKIPKCAEAAWLFGVVIIALAVAFITKSAFGVSSIVAPAYVIHLKVSQILPWYSFGTSEYILQGVLLLGMCAFLRRFKAKYLLSFVTSVVYGAVLDLWLRLLGSEPYAAVWSRCVAFGGGVMLTSFAVALFFRTYLPLQVYELLVTEVSGKVGIKTAKFKLGYDVSSLVVAILLTLAFNRAIVGIGVGTIICAAVNAPLIAFFGKGLDKVCDFSPAFPKLKRILK